MDAQEKNNEISVRNILFEHRRVSCAHPPGGDMGVSESLDRSVAPATAVDVREAIAHVRSRFETMSIEQLHRGADNASRWLRTLMGTTGIVGLVNDEARLIH